MEPTEFMLKLKANLADKTYGKDNHHLSQSTIDTYIKMLTTLNDKLPFKNLAFLRKKDEINAKLSEYAQSIQKTFLACVSSVLSMYASQRGYKGIHDYYYAKMMEKSDAAHKADSSALTQKQSDNWLPWEDVLKRKTALKEKVDHFSTKALINESDYNTLLSYTVLSLYTDLPPRRNQDYRDMVVVRLTKKEDPALLPEDTNYLVVRKGGDSQFIFNKYKTQKTYGAKTVDIPAPLADVLGLYLHFHPNRKDKQFPFLVNYKGVALGQNNAITRILNTIFEKKIGSSMLRHIYLSSKMNIADMKKDADTMGHSLTEQRQYLKTAPTPEDTIQIVE